jgi:phage terminase small subunit
MQYDFVKHYTTNGFNAEKAALQAGYEKKTARAGAYDLINRPAIKPLIERAVAKARDTILDRLSLGVEYRLKKLKSVIETYIPEDTSLFVAERVKIGLSAIQEVNKIAGDYAPDKRLALTVDLTADKLKEARKVYEDF